jgi:predicted  nucleic acid-binding Zn-ribbon protein
VAELQLENEMLLDAKENLLAEIEELESSLRRSKMDTPKYSNNKYSEYSEMPTRYDSEYNGDFNMNVQYELEKLIEKLVKELEHERHLKKKLTEEIKQLQRDILDQEKEIINKNNKIYSLEINAIKSSKTSYQGKPTRVRGRETRGVD